MEFSELFSFAITLKESLPLFPKIWKFTVPTALISSILCSFFFMLYRFSEKVVMDVAITGDNSAYIYMIPMFTTEIIFLLLFIGSIHVSGVSTTIVSALAYIGQTISPSDLLSRVRKTWRKPRTVGYRIRMPVKSLIGCFLVGVLTAAVIIVNLINPITICLLIILWTGLLIISLKSSTSRALVRVVSILEGETGNGIDAVERSEQLIQGQELKGFMLSLFMNILLGACFLIFWLIIGNKGPRMNFTIYGLFFVASMPLFSIFVSVMLTVFYFQCKKHRGEEVDVLDIVQYTKLPTTA